jgi:hypothetical protein
MLVAAVVRTLSPTFSSAYSCAASDTTTSCARTHARTHAHAGRVHSAWLLTDSQPESRPNRCGRVRVCRRSLCRRSDLPRHFLLFFSACSVCRYLALRHEPFLLVLANLDFLPLAARTE